MKEVNILDNHKIPRRFRNAKQFYLKNTLDKPYFASADVYSKYKQCVITTKNSRCYVMFGDNENKDYFIVRENYVRLKS